MALKRKSDGERLALVEAAVSEHKGDIESIHNDLRAIQRNQWLTCGVLAALMFFAQYPQFTKLVNPTEAHGAVKTD